MAGRTALRAFCGLIAAFGLLAFAASVAFAAASGPRVVLGRVHGVINPATAGYVDRLVGEAEAGGASVVVLAIDTPGGLIDPTYAIAARLLNARVPVVTWIGPSGARAASAGTFIALAGHIAAMAPATNLGAAHPVDASGGDIQGDLRLKAENDAAAHIRGIALARGRDADWAEDAVRRSVSIGTDEALRRGVVDLIAGDLQDLLARLDGRTVALPQGAVTLHTAGAAVEDAPPSPLEALLHAVADPQVAVLLFTIGTYGLIFELSNPGLIFPGIVGVIAIVLALFAFGSLDANATGIALMVFALALFVLEIKVTSHGLLTVGGLVSLLAGTILVFPSVRPTFPGVRATVEPAAVIAIVGVSALFFGVIARAAVGFRALPVASGPELLLGAVGTVKRDLAPHGIIHVADDDWSATSEGGRIPAGARVRVSRVDGVRLYVEPERVSGGKGG